MLTMQPQHAFRRSVSVSNPHLSMARRPPSRPSSRPTSRRARSTQPSPNGPSPSPSPNNGASSSMQPTSPPLFIKPLATPQELPAVLLEPCLTPEKFIDVCRASAILANLVHYIQSSHDFLSFVYVSKEMHAIVGAAFEDENDPTVRHRLFARFLPGHPLANRPHWNPRLRIDLTDLELFRTYIFRSRLASRLNPSRSRI